MIRTVIQFTGPRQLRLAEETIPDLQPGELRLRTTQTLISTGTESIAYTRNFAAGTHFDHWVRYPFCPGYLHCGIVEAVGEGVTGWQPGDRAATRGHHASHVIIAANQAVRVPPEVSDAEAAWMGLGKITQVGVRAAQHRLGDTVVVIGLGLLGQLVAQYAALAGARQIIAIDPSSARLGLLSARLPVRSFCGDAAAALPFVQQHSGGARADVVYDVTGHHAVFPAALTLARDFGTVVLLGDTGHPQQQTLTPDVITRGLHIVGAHDHHAPNQTSPDNPWTGPRMGELFLHYLARRQINVGSLITHRFPPTEAAAAYELLQTRRECAMGCVFTWS